MPKLKTKSGAAKRFSIRKGGTVKRSKAYLRHILTKKSTKRKRGLRATNIIRAEDSKRLDRMLPYL